LSPRQQSDWCSSSIDIQAPGLTELLISTGKIEPLSGVVEGTVGAWWRVLKTTYGTMQLGAQYEYVNRNTFPGVGATRGSTVAPSANESMFLVSARYYPFQ
jgi:hypothetical protein